MFKDIFSFFAHQGVTAYASGVLNYLQGLP